MGVFQHPTAPIPHPNPPTPTHTLPPTHCPPPWPLHTPSDADTMPIFLSFIFGTSIKTDHFVIILICRLAPGLPLIPVHACPAHWWGIDVSVRCTWASCRHDVVMPTSCRQCSTHDSHPVSPTHSDLHLFRAEQISGPNLEGRKCFI